MQYYSAIKRNEFESILVRWINQEPVIQSEVSQKEKNKYSILKHSFVLCESVSVLLYAFICFIF